MLVVLVAEIAAGAWAYHNKDKLDITVRAAVKNTIENEYGHVETKTVAFDTFQKHVSYIIHSYTRTIFPNDIDFRHTYF